MIERQLAILVGDANGADKAVQEYLLGKSYERVEVFCSGGGCRNNVGSWPVRDVPVSKGAKRKDFSFYATKDRVMAEEANVGLMVWDRESVGTLMNVQRLVTRGKKVVVYVAPDREFVDVKSARDWEALLSRCPAEIRNKVDRETTGERTGDVLPRQASLL